MAYKIGINVEDCDKDDINMLIASLVQLGYEVYISDNEVVFESYSCSVEKIKGG